MIRVAVGLLLGIALVSCGGEADPVSAPTPVDARPTSIFRFEDVTRRASIDTVQIGGAADVDHIIDSIGSGAAWLDYDGDGDPDLYLTQGATIDAPDSGPPDVLLRNDGDADGDGVPTFSDVTGEAGLGDRAWSFGVSVADVDGDRDPDLYVSNWGPNRLYLNQGDGTFRDIAAEAGVDDPSWSVDAAFSDVDRDGDLDLYVANYVEFAFDRYPARGERPAGGGSACVWKGIEVFCGPRNLEPAPDRFYRNEGTIRGVPRFVEATNGAGLAGTDLGESFFALTAAFVDADDDGDDDLYVANDSVRNLFFVNRGDGTFEEDSILSGLAYNEQGIEQAGMGIAAADYDGDGRIDLAVTNFSHDHDTLYRNDGDNAFSDRSYPAGIGTPSFLTLGWGLVWVDLDQDGWEDLVVAHGHVYPQVDGRDLGTDFAQPNGLFRNNGDGTFEDLSSIAGAGFDGVKSSRAVAPVDLDGDGDLDLLVTNFNDTPDLLRNAGDAGGWLKVRLHGADGNRDGIGARVTIRAGGRVQFRQVRRDVSFGASLPLAHFGLGTEPLVDVVEVRWPSGRITTLTDVTPGQVLVVDELAVPEEDDARGTRTEHAAGAADGGANDDG